ncbi:hypothetical protein SBI67_18220 [Mycolicibacterium sp. 120266]|uniref:hypothetical protein n=1 Tax=Mycolicibacterium sp. 120266 TaxID=3090601 RepID=UPI00299F2ABE|nr:hypothetical protein [Mycolicibacterium sp. 120266]MDX1874059.1 hypothetical protein [Mycolicibacterium sp. 120266]
MNEAIRTPEPEVNEWVARLADAARRGAVLDLAPGESVDPSEAAAWPPERTIPGAALRTVLTDPTLKVDPQGLRIRGALFLQRLDMEHIKFPYRLSFAFCAFNAGLNAVLAQLFHVELVHAFAKGEIRLAGARIDGQLNLTSVNLNNPQGTALSIGGAYITGGVVAKQGSRICGSVRGTGVRIDGQLNLDGASLDNPNGTALSLDGANIAGGMSAKDGFHSEGEVRAVAAQIAGQLNLNGATLNNPGRIALNLDGAHIAGSVLATDGFRARGQVRALVGRIDGQVNLAGAVIDHSDGTALFLDHAHVSGSLLATDGFHAQGEIRGVGARVDGQLSIKDAVLQNPNGSALYLERARIGSLHLQPRTFRGALNLIRATITDDINTLENPPAPLNATGWSVGDLHGPLREDWRRARTWLETNEVLERRTRPTPRGERTSARVSVQPWHALADVYDRNGDPAGARHLRLAAARQVTRQSPSPTRTLRWIYFAVAGNGYYPLVAIIWMLAILLAALSLVAVNREDIAPTDSAAARAAVLQHFGITPETKGTELAAKQHEADRFLPVTAETPCEVHPDYPCMDSFTFAVNTVVPPASSTNRDWIVASDATLALSALLPLLKLISWALAALLLAGVTGLLRKN